METTVGIFRSRLEAERALAQLKALGVGFDKITVLQPGMTNGQLEATVPTSDSEGMGTAAAMGGVVGGAIGVGAGASLGAAVVSLFVPGVGPIIAAGILGATLGASGVLAGVGAGSMLEGSLAQGLPHDELFVYEDALRHGHSVVLANSGDSEITWAIREAFLRAGAESINGARENWWLGLRKSEEQHYARTHTSNFTQDEHTYRKGFEAALHPHRRNQPYNDAVAQLDSELRADPAFRAGFERGQAYQRNLETTSESTHRDTSDTLS